MPHRGGYAPQPPVIGGAQEARAPAEDRTSPAAATPGRGQPEAITLVRALSGGGDPVTFDGEFYHVDGLDPAVAPAPRVFTGSVGPKSLAVTGQLADGWIRREARTGVASSTASRGPGWMPPPRRDGSGGDRQRL
jgi:alkanesulfonate monooxygenase SsuD/methylene tetrahydromethanopterin reductase-like flavin-dependent oxidoreductase (luciferase family)